MAIAEVEIKFSITQKVALFLGWELLCFSWVSSKENGDDD
tara:strand:- start:278 stop:397 length:120 start_codon:yes stop_codon:yes gene_type:complete